MGQATIPEIGVNAYVLFLEMKCAIAIGYCYSLLLSFRFRQWLYISFSNVHCVAECEDMFLFFV